MADEEIKPDIAPDTNDTTEAQDNPETEEQPPVAETEEGQPPSESQQDIPAGEAPPAEQSDQTAEDIKETGENQNQNEEQDGKSGTSPTEGEAEVPPAEGETEVPAAVDETEAPAAEGETEVPAAEGETEVPAAEGETKVPADEGVTEVPPAGGETSTQPTESERAKDEDPQATGEEGEEEGEAKVHRKKVENPQIPEDFFYNAEEHFSKPSVTEDSGIPANLLQLHHSFGFDCHKRDNLYLLDDDHLCYIAGNLVQILNLKTLDKQYLRSTSGGGIGSLALHPTNKYFAVAEKGTAPSTVIYEYPSLKLYRILRGGTQEAYSNCKFSPDGDLLATVGSDPDYMLTVWDWKNEQTVLRSKGFSQDIFRVSWSAELEGVLTTSGSGHIRFWKMANTFTGLKLQGNIGKFGKTEISDIEGYVELPDGKVLSGCEWGNLLVWDGGLIKVQVTRKGKKPCHQGPVQQIVMDEGELMTVGIDGYIRTWDFEAIDTAEAFDESALFELEPMNEMRVAPDVRLKKIVKALEQDSTIWFAQDENGNIWKLDLSFSHTSLAPEKIASYHAGKISDCATSPLSYLAASVGVDGNVKIFDFASNKILADNHFSGEGTKIIWAPENVDSKGKTVVAGFSDGVIRVLNFGENPETDPNRKAKNFAELALIQALKPHTQAVTALAIDETGETLATGSADQTVFFFSIGHNYEPIGFVKLDGEVSSVEWMQKAEEKSGSETANLGRILVYMNDGRVVEVVCPDPAIVDHSKTFRLTEIQPSATYEFASIKSRLRHEEELEQKRLEEEEKRKKELKERRERIERGLETEEEQKQQDEERAKKEQKEREKNKSEEEEWAPYIPEEPSPILCGFVDRNDPSQFWLSLGEFDSGYLYKCEFTSEEKRSAAKKDENPNEPTLAISVKATGDTPITVIRFSRTGKRALMGSADGRICVYTLEQEYDLASVKAFWSLSMHDNHYGSVTSVVFSHDDKFILSVGSDGNYFAYEFMDEELQDQKIKEYKAKIPSARKLETRIPDDIDDPNAYSIEEHKQKSEYDRMVRLAEEKKSATRRRINELRREFRNVKEQHEQLPDRIHLGKQEFEMVPQLRHDLMKDRDEKIELVHKELAWESEKQKIALDKLKARFRVYVECDRIVVKSFQSLHEVVTIRATVLSEDFFNLRDEMERRKTDVSTRDLTRDQTRISLIGRDAGESQAEGEGAGEDDKKKAVLKGARGERIARQLKKLEEKKQKREARKAQWEALFTTKPAEDYEDPKDIQAIQLAREQMGDFKLKTASDYVVPDHLRMNADKARQRLLEIEERIHDLKYHYNQTVFALRDKKISIIEEIKDIVSKLEEIQKTLPAHKCRTLPMIPQLDPDEVPEKKFEYTKEDLLKFKKETEEKRLAAIKGEEPATGFGGFAKPGAQPGGANPATSSKMSMAGMKVASGTSFVSESTTEIEEEDSSFLSTSDKLSELQRERMQIAHIRQLYEQDRLLRRTETLLRTFDAELRLLRHAKFELDIKLKKAELRQLTLYEEFQLLKEFEKSESVLSAKVDAKLVEKTDMSAKVVDVQQKLEAKKKDIEKLQEREKNLHETFKQSLGESNKFADYLTKVFKKKIKRKKKEAEGAESDESDESSDEDDSDFDESEEESDEEGVVFDLDMCPPGCDQQLYDGTCQLREKRLDIEEELTEEKKVLEILKKEFESLTKKSKIIDTSLKHAENELEAFQLEKQQKLNELEMIVILRLNQVLYNEGGVLPSDLSVILVFERQNLIQLRRRINALEEEKLQQRRQQKEAKKRHIQLMKNRKLFQAKIEETQDKCDQMMIDKFGKIDDLERLEQVVVNPKIEELTEKMLIQQAEMFKEQEEWEDKIREAKNGLIEETRENTKYLTQMLMLYSERKELETGLDSKQKNLGSEFATTRPADIEEMARLMQLVQIQAQELNALKEEIGMLSRKGGHILPPVQAPSMPEKSQHSLM